VLDVTFNVVRGVFSIFSGNTDEKVVVACFKAALFGAIVGAVGTPLQAARSIGLKESLYASGRFFDETFLRSRVENNNELMKAAQSLALSTAKEIQKSDFLGENALRVQINSSELLHMTKAIAIFAMKEALRPGGIFNVRSLNDRSGYNEELFLVLVKKNFLKNAIIFALLLPVLLLFSRMGLSLVNRLDSWMVLHGHKNPPIPSLLSQQLEKLRTDLLQAAEDFRARSQQIERTREANAIASAKKNSLASQINELVDQIDEEKMSSYLCPITRTVMRYPVRTADGYYFEQSAIAAWYATGYKKCLFDETKLLTDPDNLTVDIQLQEKILSKLNELLQLQQKSARILHM